MLVLWDEDCGLCAFLLGIILRWDRAGRLRTAAIQGPAGDRWLASMPMEQRLASWHAVDADGRVTSAGAALPGLFALLPGGAPFAWLTARLPGPTERAYRWIAEHRPLLSRFVPAAAKTRGRALVTDRADCR